MMISYPIDEVIKLSSHYSHKWQQELDNIVKNIATTLSIESYYKPFVKERTVTYYVDAINKNPFKYKQQLDRRMSLDYTSIKATSLLYKCTMVIGHTEAKMVHLNEDEISIICGRLLGAK